MNLLKQRIIPALILSIVALGFLIPVSIFASTHFEARITSFIVTSLLLIIVLFELFKAQRMNIYLAIIFALITAGATIAFPLNLFQINYLPNASNVAELTQFSYTTLSSYVLMLAKDYISFLIILGISIVFFVLEWATKTQMKTSDRFMRMLFIFITLYVIINAVKVLNLFITLNWRYWVSAILIAAAYDTMGFFGGKFFGKKWIKKPFAPVISPKKTWEGFIFGVIGGSLIAFALAFGFNLFDSTNNISRYLGITSFAILSPIVACTGDLYFSAIKRLNAIKDYSKILVGHGGFLDRFDSIIFVLFFIFLLLLLV
ncbi:phosphatidate cytidylyltransferase [Mycoplasmopsis columbinasalis]|uniref:Phosphatidate cytidylyltransferase n=1 Tax=Mycoplasmopsis columbinasalis TaxID=114880 RepID=A0A449BA49_9BACT|nr:phosphatidate cytidylyltransferase [Mycoplasmopsis columbinasalis]VEU78074.1 Phosphatidate cytidylyltransferase [Mycoplasmopsis columbinasalis]